MEIAPLLPISQNLSENSINAQTTFWDPVDPNLTDQSFYGARKELLAKYEKYKKSPRMPLIYLCLLCIPLIIEIALIGIYQDAFFTFLKTMEDDSLYFLLIPLGPPIWYIYKVFKVQKDLIKLLIANEHNWLYNPDEKQDHWMKFARILPEIFQKGTEGQNLQDEFWGKFKSERQDVDFYSGLFEFKIATRGRRGRRTQTYQKSIFLLHLNKNITARFLLEPENFMHKFINYFSKKEVDTESAEFNKIFAVYYSGQKVEKEMDIIKTLTPAVQVKLIALQKEKGQYSLLFSGDTVVFAFEKDLFKNMKTNFFKKVELDPRDKEEFNKTLNTILEISSEIVPYLD